MKTPTDVNIKIINYHIAKSFKITQKETRHSHWPVQMASFFKVVFLRIGGVKKQAGSG